MTHSIWNFLLFEQNVATVNHFVVAYKVIFVWLAYHRSMLVVVQHGLIGLSGIGWACLLYFDHAGGWKCIVYNVSSFSNWAMLYFRKCNTEQLKICWSLPIFLNYFEGMLFQFICCLYDCDYFSSLLNSLAELTALFTIEIVYTSFLIFLYIYELFAQSSWTQNCLAAR